MLLKGGKKSVFSAGVKLRRVVVVAVAVVLKTTNHEISLTGRDERKDLSYKIFEWTTTTTTNRTVFWHAP